MKNDKDNVVNFEIKQKPRHFYPSDLEPPKPKWIIEFNNVEIHFVSTPIPNWFQRKFIEWFFGCSISVYEDGIHD